MNRNKPAISPAQLKNLAKVSAAQAMQRAALGKAQKHQKELELSIDTLNRDVVKLHEWRNSRVVAWLSRILLAPMFLTSFILCVAVLAGLWTGEIRGIEEWSETLVDRKVNPVKYWLFLLYHCAVAAIQVWLSFLCLRIAKLGNRNAA